MLKKNDNLSLDEKTRFQSELNYIKESMGEFIIEIMKHRKNEFDEKIKARLHSEDTSTYVSHGALAPSDIATPNFGENTVQAENIDSDTSVLNEFTDISSMDGINTPDLSDTDSF